MAEQKKWNKLKRKNIVTWFLLVDFFGLISSCDVSSDEEEFSDEDLAFFFL